MNCPHCGYDLEDRKVGFGEDQIDKKSALSLAQSFTQTTGKTAAECAYDLNFNHDQEADLQIWRQQ